MSEGIDVTDILKSRPVNSAIPLLSVWPRRWDIKDIHPAVKARYAFYIKKIDELEAQQAKGNEKNVKGKISNGQVVPFGRSPFNLDTLPGDIYHHIVPYLQCFELNNLVQVNRTLYLNLNRLLYSAYPVRYFFQKLPKIDFINGQVIERPNGRKKQSTRSAIASLPPYVTRLIDNPDSIELVLKSFPELVEFAIMNPVKDLSGTQNTKERQNTARNTRKSKSTNQRLLKITERFSDNLGRLRSLHLGCVDGPDFPIIEKVLEKCTSLELLYPTGLSFHLREFMEMLSRCGVGRTLKRLFLRYPMHQQRKFYIIRTGESAAQPNIFFNSIGNAALFPRFESLILSMMPYTDDNYLPADSINPNDIFWGPYADLNRAPTTGYQRYLLLRDLFSAQTRATVQGVSWKWNQEEIELGKFCLSVYEVSFFPRIMLSPFLDWLAKMVPQWGRNRYIRFPTETRIPSDIDHESLFLDFFGKLGKDWIDNGNEIAIEYESTLISDTGMFGEPESFLLVPIIYPEDVEGTENNQTDNGNTNAGGGLIDPNHEWGRLKPAELITNLKLCIREMDFAEVGYEYPEFDRLKWRTLPESMKLAVVNRDLTNIWTEGLSSVYEHMVNLKKLTLSGRDFFGDPFGGYFHAHDLLQPMFRRLVKYHNLRSIDIDFSSIWQSSKMVPGGEDVEDPKLLKVKNWRPQKEGKKSSSAIEPNDKGGGNSSENGNRYGARQRRSSQSSTSSISYDSLDDYDYYVDDFLDSWDSTSASEDSDVGDFPHFICSHSPAASVSSPIEDAAQLLQRAQDVGLNLRPPSAAPQGEPQEGQEWQYERELSDVITRIKWLSDKEIMGELTSLCLRKLFIRTNGDREWFYGLVKELDHLEEFEVVGLAWEIKAETDQKVIQKASMDTLSPKGKGKELAESEGVQKSKSKSTSSKSKPGPKSKSKSKSKPISFVPSTFSPSSVGTEVIDTVKSSCPSAGIVKGLQLTLEVDGDYLPQYSEVCNHMLRKIRVASRITSNIHAIAKSTSSIRQIKVSLGDLRLFSGDGFEDKQLREQDKWWNGTRGLGYYDFKEEEDSFLEPCAEERCTRL